MRNEFYTNYSETKFIDKLKKNLDTCQAFYFSVSFIKKRGLHLLAPNIDAALARGAKGQMITSTYQNFTDIDSLNYFLSLQSKYPDRFSCHLDKECFHDNNGNTVGFHSKGYLFEMEQVRELLIGSSNITVYALLKNVEWDVSVIDRPEEETWPAAKQEFDMLWEKTEPLTREIIEEYRTRLYYSIERWDMDYEIANAAVKPNYMQRRALKELNRIRALGAERALVCSAAGSGKTFLAAFDALNYNPKRLLYIVHEGSILLKSFETFQRVFGNEKSYGILNGEYKETSQDFIFSTNITMANAVDMNEFPVDTFDYIIIDECHHAVAETYRKIINYFKPEFLLGITATPERMDGEDVFSLFDQNVPYELRLRDAIINGLVVPFHYYGIRDDLIEYGLQETKGHKFVEQFSDDAHCEFISKEIEKHRLPGQKLKALAFCRDISHAIRMAQAMEEYYHTAYLTGRNSAGERIRTYKDLQDDGKELEILFTVDILNEGVDIPGVNMVLFLRPTDSQTIFIQQLGRGLRLYEGKEYVTVLDFIGNDYKRSVQIAFALGSLSDKFVMEKKLVAALIAEDYKSLGLAEYGVNICLDDLSKKEILSFIDEVNFNTKRFLKQDYESFKKYLNTGDYPKHVDYLNNDFAPDLIKFMQSKIQSVKTGSYYHFLCGIDEENLPAFDERQKDFVKYVSEMLPLVRPYEYLMIQKILDDTGITEVNEMIKHIKTGVPSFSQDHFNHALHYMVKSGFFIKDDDIVALDGINLNTELDEYLHDLIEFGLGKYDAEFVQFNVDANSRFHLWAKYRKEQIQQLLLENPKNIMKGTQIINDVVYIYVKIVKDLEEDATTNYVDGYITPKVFQWETESHLSDKTLEQLKNSSRAEVFVRMLENEDGIQLPLIYVGPGKMEFVPGSKKKNGAYLFNITMENEAPEDVYFDFKLR